MVLREMAVRGPGHPGLARLHPEREPGAVRGFELDVDRVVHTAAYRRLARKTQVFIDPAGDHVRNRLTHTGEVARVARRLSRHLGLDEDLAEVVALAHDLGHPPFGHVGEGALDRALAAHGGYDHNAQAARIVDSAPAGHASYPGLNLCRDTVEGILAHNGPLLRPDGSPVDRSRSALDPAYRQAAHSRGIDLASHASAEAQCAALADDIAYDCHDLEDGFRSGMLSLDDLSSMPLVGNAMRACGAWASGGQLVQEAVRRLREALVDDALAASSAILSDLGSQAAVRARGRPAVVLSPAMARAERRLKHELRERVYHSHALAPERDRAREVVASLVEAFVDDPGLMPPPHAPSGAVGDAEVAARVRDYVSGMTDRYAIREHARVRDRVMPPPVARIGA